MEFDVAFLDVGQGDCTVFTFTESDETSADANRTRCIVVDGGEEGSKGVSHLQPDAPPAAWRLAEYLKARGIRAIDLLIATHIDSEHIGGLLTFLRDHTAKEDGLGSSYWNDRVICIGQYWGPTRGVHNRSAENEQSKGRAKGHREMMRLLAKFKVKMRQRVQDAEEIERLEREILGLREKLETLVVANDTRGYVAQSVGQSHDLTETVRLHVADPDRDMKSPDLTRPAASPFASVQVKVLWPDVQVPDSTIRASMCRPVNATTRPLRSAKITEENRPPQRRLDLAGLLGRVLDNQESLARVESRKTDSRSIVVSVRPTQWNGPVSSWPVILLAGDADSESWRGMIRRHSADDLSALILKVPNHGGSANGITGDALRIIHPRYAIISVGQTGHSPAASTLNLLRQGTEGPLDILCTERNHNPKMAGACLQLPPGCVRHTFDDYRGVSFGFDTGQGSTSVSTLRFVREGDQYELDITRVHDYEKDPQHVLWCRQEKWEDTAKQSEGA